MNWLDKIVVSLMMFNCFIVSGQWNIQTGYDYGSFTIPATKQRGFNYLHRINIINEYVFKNNLIASINSGIDFHRINYTFNYRTTNSSGITIKENFYSNKINVQNYRVGSSLGYQLNMNETSSVQFKISYDHYFVNNVSIKESYRIENFYNMPANEIDDNEPTSSSKYFFDLINFEKIGFKNKFIKENRNIVFSLGYRYQINDFFIHPSIGFSPWNRGLILSKGQNLFLIGLNLGYTLPQKNKSNEK